MPIKYTQSYLNKLENLFSNTLYILRYEKGNFRSGYCILNENKVAVINKFYTIEGKINCLIDLLKSIEVDTNKLSPKNQNLFQEISQTKLNL